MTWVGSCLLCMVFGKFSNSYCYRCLCGVETDTVRSLIGFQTLFLQNLFPQPVIFAEGFLVALTGKISWLTSNNNIRHSPMSKTGLHNEMMETCAIRWETATINSNIIITITMIMFRVLSSWPRSLREFTRFIWWMQTERWVAANPQTKPTDLGCESADKWLLRSTSTVAICYYYSARMLILILQSHRQWKAELI